MRTISYVFAVFTLFALLAAPVAAQDQEPPVVPVTPVTPATPVDPPAPMPDPPTPAEQTAGQQALAAFQLVLDTLGQHDRGAADMAEAEAAVTAAQGTLTRAEQHLADVEGERTASATTLVEHVRAAITVLEALVVAYSPAGQ